MNNKVDGPSTEKLFDLLYDTLEKYNQRYVTASIATASILMVIIGWLLTNKMANDFFQDSLVSTLFFTFIIIPFLIFTYVSPMLRVFNVNHEVFEEIQKLDYIDKKYYEHHKLKSSYKFIGIVLNVSNYVILGILALNAHWHILQNF